MPKLFAVYLGGNALGSNIELHDVQFVVGETIEQTYPELLKLWFGMPEGLHLDSYMPLDIVDGHRLTLSLARTISDQKLFFVNLGAYRVNTFGEYHSNKFIVAKSAQIAKERAKAELMQDWGSPVHKDNLIDVDDCVEVATSKWLIELKATDKEENLVPVNGYHLIPKDIVAAFKATTNRRQVARSVRGHHPTRSKCPL